MKTPMLKIASTLLLAIASLSASATPLLIEGGPRSSGFDCTFACVNHYQQAYDNTAFGTTPVAISGVSFFAGSYGSSWAEGNLWQINLSTSAYEVNSLSSTFSANLGSDNALFAVKSFSGAPVAGEAITFNGSFNYDPTKGDLLVDIIALGATGGPSVHYNRDSNGVFSRVFQFDQSLTGYANANYGNVTSFDVTATAVPEPASFMLLAFGLAGLAVARRQSKRA